MVHMQKKSHQAASSATISDFESRIVQSCSHSMSENKVVPSKWWAFVRSNVLPCVFCACVHGESRSLFVSIVIINVL